MSFQVKEASYERWGGPEAIEEEQDRRKRRKYDEAVKRTQGVFRSGFPGLPKKS
jgi:hypothetical protein